MSNSINLLDLKGKVIATKSKKQSPLRILAAGLLFIVSASSLVSFLLVALSPLPQLEKQHKVAIFNLSLASSDIIKLEIVKDRVNSIEKILDKRPYYDKLLSTLQAKLPSGVSVDNFSIKKDTVLITLSSKSLLLLDNFSNNILNSSDSEKNFKNIKLVALSTDENNRFLMTLSMNLL